MKPWMLPLGSGSLDLGEGGNSELDTGSSPDPVASVKPDPAPAGAAVTPPRPVQVLTPTPAPERHAEPRRRALPVVSGEVATIRAQNIPKTIPALRRDAVMKSPTRHSVLIPPPAAPQAPLRKLGDWFDERVIDLAINGVTSARSREEYGRCLHRFMAWFREHPNRSLDRPTVQAYIAHMLHEKGLRATSANQALAAIKKMVHEAMNANLIAHAIAAPILVLPGAPVSGTRAGNWLSRAQAQELLLKPDTSTLMGKRDQAALALLIGAALRRSEVCGLRIEQIEQRRGRWVLANMLRKGGRLQTVPIPAWTYESVARWIEAAELSSGPVIRGFAPDGVSLQSGGLTSKQLYLIVRRYGAATGSKLAPHDLRRTAADLMWEAEASMREIQTALGHKSLTTTEIYMQPITDMKAPACDRVKFEV